MTEQQQELDLEELNEALKNLDQGGDEDPPKKDNKGNQNEQSKEATDEQQQSNTEKDEKRKVDIETVYHLISKMKNEDNQSNTKKQSKQKKPKTEKQQKQFEELQRKREEKRERERKEKEKQKLLQDIDIDSIVNEKLERILSQYEQEQQPQHQPTTTTKYQPSTTAPQAFPAEQEKVVYPYEHLVKDPPKSKKQPDIFKKLGLKENNQQKTRNQPTTNKVPSEPKKEVNVFDFFKRA